MPENILKIKEKIPYEWKLAFCTSVIIGLLTHIYVFTNRLPNHDGLLNIYGSQAKVTSGRFFLGPASGLSSYFDLPWVIGLFSILFLALTAVCIITIFEVKKRISIVLISGIVVTFPSVSATFSYMFTADGYMLGALFSSIAVLLTKKYKLGFLYGAIFLCLGVGIYQANLSVAMALLTIWLMHEILFKAPTIKNLGKNILRSGLLVGIGMLLYLVVYKIYTGLFEVKMTSYQGLDKVGGLSIHDIPMRFNDITEQLKVFFFRGFYFYQEVNLLEILNLGIVIITIVWSIIILIKRNIIKNFIQTIIFILLFISLPISYYIVYFVSPTTFYHMLMIFSISTIYIYLVLLYESIDVNGKLLIEKIASWVTVLLLALTIYNFSLIANINYMNMELRYEKSISFANRVLNRVEQLENYNDIEKISVVGKISLYSELTSVTIPNKIPMMMGGTGEHFLNDVSHYQKLFSNFLGYQLAYPTPEELDKIKSTEGYRNMKPWPAKESVQVIDDILVIKLADE
ncbi:glucosyltransferase domain-containing protein [Ureibacillus chungkukjangi]|uniref:Glucosyltransferase GtrII-like protein n=1 Tax=Ureibacillus chungkukjangi TaxID=1202712 RepID=A0A318TUN8_9BACL|nr:glucosyltransferase domain-containing protein [Ureibacillus chungkukjangi]PYF07580.1 glucosyltransferase GtrII-like protein [Ureibacillus chungkukjangi]